MRYLSPAQSDTLKPHVKGGMLDATTGETMAVAATLGIRPGRYTVDRYTVSSEPNRRTGKVSANAGKRGLTLEPADDATGLELAAATARARADKWSDKGWIKSQRAAAVAKAEEAEEAARAARHAGKGPGKGKSSKGKGKG